MVPPITWLTICATILKFSFQSRASILIVGAVNGVEVPQEWFEDFHLAYLDDPAFPTVFKLIPHLDQTQTDIPTIS